VTSSGNNIFKGAGIGTEMVQVLILETCGKKMRGIRDNYMGARSVSSSSPTCWCALPNTRSLITLSAITSPLLVAKVS
jgi:hypothetical protein